MTWLKNEWLILWSTHRKWAVTVLAFLATVVNTGLAHGTVLHVIQLVIAALTAAGVRKVTNESAPPPEG